MLAPARADDEDVHSCTRIALVSRLRVDGAMDDQPLTAAAAWGEPGRSNLPEYTVSELSLALKRSIEDGFGQVRVRGEISGFKRHGSGHCYFALKDTDAVLDAVCWRTTAIRLDLKPEDGMEVVCSGRLTTYPGRSKYQLVVDRIELAGKGALLRLLEERRLRLAAEGLFAAERKQKLPFLPAVIGIVTSPTGAVIRDILHRLADRFPRHVLIWPVAVQGEGAAAQVAAAIDGFNRLTAGGSVPRPDLIIVARGGGSLEDLMAFNEEIVVRAAAASAIPLISAVGHETDTTLIDHASDRRAPTPTAAAEMAVPVRLDLVADLAGKIGAPCRQLVAALCRAAAAPRRPRARPARPARSARRRRATPRRPQRAAAPGDPRPLRGGTNAARPGLDRSAADRARRRCGAGARPARRCRATPRRRDATRSRREARRRRQFRRPARDPFRAPREPSGARLCRGARRRRARRHRCGQG